MLDGVSLIRCWETSRQTGGGSYCARLWVVGARCWLWADRQMFCVANPVEAALKYQRNSGSAEQQRVQRGSGGPRCWRRVWAHQLLYWRQAPVTWLQEVDDRKSWRLNSRNSEVPKGSHWEGPAALAPFPLPPWFLQQCPDSCQRCVAAEGVASWRPTVLLQKQQTVCFCLHLLKHSNGLIWMKTIHNCHHDSWCQMMWGCLRRRKASAGSVGQSHPGWFPKSSS